MLSDQIREQGQKQYEFLEKQIRENGEKWLREEEEEQKKLMEVCILISPYCGLAEFMRLDEPAYI